MATLTAVALVGRGGDTRGRGGAWAAESCRCSAGGSWRRRLVRRLAAALLAAAMRGRRCCGGDVALSSRLTCARDSKHWQSAGAAGAFECARRAGRLLDGHSRESGGSPCGAVAAVARRPLSVRHRDRVALSRLAMLQAGRGTFVATFNRENATHLEYGCSASLKKERKQTTKRREFCKGV